MGEENNWMDVVLEKLKEWLQVIGDFFGSLIEKSDEVFPPETRGDQLLHWLQVAAPYLIGGVVLFLFLCCCCRCCRCCCGGGRGDRMMKAPGRNYRMPRRTFESNPRSYFRNLRANPSYQLV